MMPNMPIMAVNQEKSKVYGITMMPNKRYALMEEKAVFGTVHHKIVLRLRYSSAAFLYALRGVSHTVTSRELVRQVPPQSGCSPLVL
jgi:hypothetical protein